MPPISQREIANDWDRLARLCRNRIVAIEMLFTLTPASNRVNDESRRPSAAIPSTTDNVSAAPEKAQIQAAGTPATDDHPSAIATTAPSDDPLEMPSVKGSASGSRSSAWKSTPVRV